MSSNGTLLRKYISRRLSAYYSQPANKVVGFVSGNPSGTTIPSIDASQTSPQKKQAIINHAGDINGIDFSSLWGEWHWKRTYKRVYENQQGMWLTPCELFKPYYSNVLANFVSETTRSKWRNARVSGSNSNAQAFEIVELGGGRGTNAKAIMDHLRSQHPDIYARLRRYKIFDTSPTLHQLQRELFNADASGSSESSCYADKIQFFNIDMMDVAEGNEEFLSQSDIPTVVIALELLDNLPHDKIARCTETNRILQAEVVPTYENSCRKNRDNYTVDISLPHMERFSPVSDPLLQRILSVAPKLHAPMAAHGPHWVPTVALGVLMKLFECRPNSSVLFADFDWLPPPVVGEDNASEVLAEPSVNDPLVTDMNGNDHICYLTTPPDALCDVLFPTDFRRLATFVQHFYDSQKKSNRDNYSQPILASSMKQHSFLLKYGANEVDKTRSWLTGYSPLIHDFLNCSVLEVVPK